MLQANYSIDIVFSIIFADYFFRIGSYFSNKIEEKNQNNIKSKENEEENEEENEIFIEKN